MKSLYSIFFFSFITLCSCVEPQNSFSKIPPGVWRGILYLSENPQFAGSKKEIIKKTDFTGEMPFNFEVIYTDKDHFYIELINDTERIKIEDVEFNTAKSINKDSVTIHFKEFDTRIEALYENSTMEGKWIVNYKDNYSISFKATHGKDYRFEPVKKDQPKNFSGTWEAIFDSGSENAYPGVAVFKQNGSKITGTVETETGDYRYLQGDVFGDKAFLSCFDGSHAFMIEAKLNGDSTLTGSFRSGKHYTVTWDGKKNEKATLKDAYGLSKSTTESPVNFSLPDHQGRMVSLKDEKFAGKVKILDIMGTWCPNCKDATIYLKELKKNIQYKNVEVISLAFERYRDSIKSQNMLDVYKKKNDLTWDLLLGGYYDKKEAQASLGFIDKVVAYPTLVILDKNDKVSHVYTGFYGPATGKYETFKTDFEGKLGALLK